ncbi:MAG: UbiA prenyltransferase family protein [Lachnospiraceae bacterium]|nr:UbiA prenyltransferase family protein [Lachnospiraceae bacterium]
MKRVFDYIRIMRLDHWIKQLFVVPGIVMGLVLVESHIDKEMLIDIVIGFIATCIIASSNYVINEWLDAKTDKYHPIKKHRSVVENDLNQYIVYTLYFSLAIIGLIIGYTLSLRFFIVLLCLWIMGIIYNVKPIRSKDVPYIDVLTESINNALRLLLGWFVVTGEYYPPISVVMGYWFAGAFLMNTKRLAEYRMIGDKNIAQQYRKSFKYYSITSLLLISVFYGMLSVLFIGIFLIKYRIELILFMPFLIGLFCYYFYIAFKDDSAAQRPEKLYKEKGLLIYVGICIALFIVLMQVDIPWLNVFTVKELVPIR